MIIKPTLILDELKCKKNIFEMFLKAQKSKVDFRPHFKTHQSLEIGRWFKELGVNKITVSSLSMAQYFAEDWNDITVAFPVNILEIDTINQLAEKITLNLLIESVESIDFLINYLTQNVSFFIKIDVGYNRTGIPSNETSKIDQILVSSEKSDLLNFKGFLTHAGHTYKCRNKKEILAIYQQSIDQLDQLEKSYRSKYPDLIISFGDTPSCSVAEDFSMFDEIRPGNFVFYDLSQYQIGSCEIDQIAVAMACPIVAIHPDRNELVIYGGGVHFSKEAMNDADLGMIYGKIVKKKGNTWRELIPDFYVKSLSQEHGIISLPESEISNFKVGDILFILPVHTCMTADVFKSYKTTNGKIIARS